MHYFHLNCIFTSFQKARSTLNIISDISEIDGVEMITPQERLQIKTLIEEVDTTEKPITRNPVPKDKRSTVKQSTPKSRKAKLSPSNLPSMKIMFTNADQLTSSKMIELRKRIESEEPLIVAVSEVKPKNSSDWSTKDYEIPDYNLHSVNLDTVSGRGMAVYSHKSITNSVTQINSDLTFEEVCILELRLRGGDLLLFASCYRSPTRTESSPQNNEKLNRLLKCFEKRNYSHRCIVGDFNFRKINWSTWTTPCNEDSAEASFIEAIRDSYLHQHIEQATRKRGNDEPSVLDLIFTDESMQVSDIQYLSPLDKSDHSVITFNYHCYIDFTKPKENYSYAKGDYSAMRNDLESSSWKQNFTVMNVSVPQEEIEVKWLALKTKLIELREKYVPKRQVSDKPPWKTKGFPINKRLQEAIKSKKRTHRTWIRSADHADRELARLTYTKARNKVKTLLRQAKRLFEKGIALQAKTNPKAFWAHTRRKLKTKCSIAPLLADKNDKESLKFDDVEKANILQKQFSSVYTHEPEGEIPTIDRRTDKRISDLYISEEMVLKQLINLNVNKSCGPDNLHPRMLKELAEQIAGPISHLFNLTIKFSIIPEDWKRAFVSPIYKKGLKCHAENYRPISLTSVFCKIIETFVREKIMKHLHEQRLLSAKQHGFISGRSTTIQLLNYLDKCTQAIVDGGVVDTIYLDFEKAFDTVPHRRLLGKLRAYGIDGNILSWISEFLSGRSQEVIVNGEKSISALVLSGIPQGTVLGPVLFVIYINDILDNIKSEGLLFADDTKIFQTITSQVDSLILQSDIQALENWSKKWLLRFHPDKCHVLTLGKFENIKHTERYKICNEEMDHVFEQKDLGVIIDSDLTFEEHISTKIRVANAIVGLIRRSFTYLDCKSFKTLFTTFVRPHLEYAQSVWAPHLKKYINLLENVQVRATKLVDGLGNMEYKERLSRLNLPTLAYRRQRGDMIEIYKHFHAYDQESLSSSFQPRERSSRMHDFQLHYLKPKDGIRGIQSNAFYYRTPKIWNNLPKTVVNAKSINAFKNKLDDFWKDEPIMYDHTVIMSDS